MSKVFKYFCASRILFFLFAMLATQAIPLREGYLGEQIDPVVPYFAWIWSNFDGRHFLNIATLGYQHFDFAFFPLYPLLINIFDYLLPLSPLLIGILISLISFLIAALIIYKIISIDFGENIARGAIFFLSFSPFAFFYNAVYADALFLLLSSTSFYFARKGNWFLSGVFGCLTVLTRLSGLALIPALGAEWYLQQKKPLRQLVNMVVPFLRTGAVALILTGAGLIIYMFYLQFFHGDFLLFQKSMIAWRQNEFIFPPQVIWRYIKIFFLVDKSLLVYWIAILEFFSFFVYIGLAVYVWKKVRASYGIFMMVLLLLVTFTGTFAGTPRYILHLFPAFLGIALLIYQYPRIRMPLIVLFIVLGFILTGLFTRGYFIA